MSFENLAGLGILALLPEMLSITHAHLSSGGPHARGASTLIVLTGWLSIGALATILLI